MHGFCFKLDHLEAVDCILQMTDTTAIVTPDTEEEKDVNSDPDGIKELKSSEDTGPENGDAVSSPGSPKKEKSKSDQS